MINVEIIILFWQDIFCIFWPFFCILFPKEGGASTQHCCNRLLCWLLSKSGTTVAIHCCNITNAPQSNSDQKKQLISSRSLPYVGCCPCPSPPFYFFKGNDDILGHGCPPATKPAMFVWGGRVQE